MESQSEDKEKGIQERLKGKQGNKRGRAIAVFKKKKSDG